MTEQSATTDPKPPTDPRPPCPVCGSRDHTAGYHDGGAPPRDGGMSPMGYHDGGLAAENFGKDSDSDDGGTPAR
ncbi:MAG TPA: hypothetical protein VGP26_21775 [Actinophytocola sp.]|jgi:hypothetical protein|nr:hypothetical protein [Actinophytocola sp.]